MMRIKEVIVVEGRYDKNTVSQAVDATIIEVSGFKIFSDDEKIALLRTLADKRGLIILTDSDRAGFFIRGRLKGMLEGVNVKHAYIPDILGRERRKSRSSKEGKLGVEGMSIDVIISALKQAGAKFENDHKSIITTNLISKADLFEAGLSGSPNSANKRREFLKRLNLPERLSTNALLDVLNALYTRDEFFDLI
jgi:ribonuclease M5